MTRSTTCLLATCSLLFFGLSACSSSDDQNARDIAQALADRMASELDFDDATPQPGPPPEGHPAHPAEAGHS